jgi:hypothetical protein
LNSKKNTTFFNEENINEIIVIERFLTGNLSYYANKDVDMIKIMLLSMKYVSLFFVVFESFDLFLSLSINAFMLE